LAISLELVVFVTMLWLVFTPQSLQSINFLQLSLSITALIAIAWNALYRERRWGRPVRRLIELLPQIRTCQATVESLRSIGGLSEPLVEELACICHELHRLRSDLTDMEANLRRHVASRTNALERTIGSLKQQATRDALTGLHNRRAMNEHLPQAVERCQAARTDLCLLMIDVDHFKQLNDTCGHPAGDELLRNIGQIIRSTIRDGDVAFRYGGDEFAIVMEGQAEPAGQTLGERLRSLVDGLARTIRVNPSPRLSIGIATLKQVSPQDANALLQAADQSLYEIKKSRKASSDGKEKVKRGKGM
jgi:diguanylate cyclase (GGDEF)-like protein